MRYQCLDRIPPDCTGRQYYEGEAYDLSPAELEKLQKGGHLGATYGDQVVEPHFEKLGGDEEPAPAPATDLESLTKAALVDMAAELGVEITAGATKADIIAAIGLARG